MVAWISPRRRLVCVMENRSFRNLQIEDPTREERYKFFFDGINNLAKIRLQVFMNILYDFKPEDSPMRRRRRRCSATQGRTGKGHSATPAFRSACP